MFELVKAAASAVFVCLAPPVDAPVARGFEPPPCEFCAGHRTLEFGRPDASPPMVVRAAVAGRVRFAGPVAGTAYVSIEPTAGPGETVTIGWVPADPGVFVGLPALGRRLEIGDPIGWSMGRATLSLRSAVGEYQDPTPHLGRIRRRARLVPVDGQGRRPPHRAVCQPLR